jgi:hypothetical protein
LINRDCIYVLDYIPLRVQLLQDHHDPPAVGRPGRAKTLELHARRYYWPSMRKDVDHFVRNCHIRRRTKSTRHTPYGILRPLSVPEQPWQHISVDFVPGLPRSKGFDTICVVVDRLTKQWHLIPYTPTVIAEGLVDLFCDRIFRYHGLPETIVSDRGPQFASHFWKHLCSNQEKIELRPVHPDALDALDISDPTCFNRTQLATAPCIRTQRASAPCIRTRSATAYTYWTRSVRAFSF